MKFKVDIQELKDDPPPKKKDNGLVLFCICVLALGYCLKIMPDCGWGNGFCKERDVHNPQFNANYYFYDTNLGYDQTIRKNLSLEQMRVFDSLLRVEATNSGIPLDIECVKRLVSYDRQIIDAYYRWLRIKRLYRSNGHVVYPDDRQTFQAATLQVDAY